MKKFLKKILMVSVAAGTFIFNPAADNLNPAPTVYAKDIGLEHFEKMPFMDRAKKYTKGTDFDSPEFWNNLKEKLNNASPLEREIFDTLFDVEKMLNFINVIDKKPSAIYTTEEFENALTGIEESKKIAQRILAFKRILDGINLESQNNFEDATLAYNQAFGIEPGYAPNYYFRGLIYVISPLTKDKAVSDFNKAVEINPNAPVPYIFRSTMYLFSEQYDKSISDINKVVEMYPEDYFSYVIRGFMFETMGKYENSVEDFSKAIELKSNNKGIIADFDNLYNLRAEIYIKLAQYDNAVADYSKIVELKPDNADSYYGRGKIYVQIKNYEKAIADFDKAIEIDPENIEFYSTRGNCYQKLGEKKKAKADFAKVKKLEDKIRKDFNKRKKS